MFFRLLRSLLFLSLVTVPISAQLRDPSIEERAKKLEPFIVESARIYGIDAEVLRVVCYLESRFRTEAVSPKGARGPMQFMPETAARYGLRNPHDPSAAVDAGARYLRDLLLRFRGRIDLALAAYNAGEGTVEAFISGRSLRVSNGKIINSTRRVTGGIPPYRETKHYVRMALALLKNRRPLPIRSLNFSLRTSEESRDFTIDVTSEGFLIPRHLSERARSLFIEIH